MVVSKRMREVKALIFDMDGVLLDTIRVYRSMWEKPLSGYGIDVDEMFAFSLGLPYQDFPRHLKEKYGNEIPWDQVCHQRKTDSRAWFKDNSPPVKPGVIEMLELGLKCGLPMAVATSTEQEDAVRHLEKAKLLHYFKEIIGGDRTLKAKPDPSIYLLTANLLEVSPENCLGFEDSYSGICALNSAGMLTAIIHDFHPVTPQMQKLAHLEFVDMNHARNWAVENKILQPPMSTRTISLQGADSREIFNSQKQLQKTL